MICSGKRWKRGAWSRAARRRRSPAKPRAAKEEICFARRRDGNARLSLARRRTSAAWRRAAKEERSKAWSGEGGAGKRTDPRRTGNGPIRRGVEQPSWDRLRMATAQTRYATSGDGKVAHCSVMAKQSRGMQRRWTDTGSEGVALRSRAWRRQSEAWQGEAKRGKAKAWLVRDLIGVCFGMQCNTTERHGSAERWRRSANPGGAWRWRGDETLCD